VIIVQEHVNDGLISADLNIIYIVAWCLNGKLLSVVNYRVNKCTKHQFIYAC